jgi:hypothetical protein
MMMCTTTKLAFININGLRNKVDRIREYITKEGIDIMCLVETWLEKKDNLALRPVQIDIRQDKKEGMTRGNGGIVVVAKRDIPIREVERDRQGNWVLFEAGHLTIAVAYFAPSEDKTHIADFFTFLEHWYTQHSDRELVIMGDFNARCKELTGDGATTSRGRWLHSLLGDTFLCNRRPDMGKWTSYNPRGKGITDLALVPRAHDPIQQMTVHEKVSLGSDHRMLTLEILTATIEGAHRQERWNLSRLMNMQTDYTTGIKTALPAWYVTLNGCKKKISNWHKNKLNVPAADRVQLVDTLWLHLKDVLRQELIKSCGVMSDASYINKDFLTADMETLQRKLAAAERSAQAAIDLKLCKEVRFHRWANLRTVRKQWFRRTGTRRTVVYRKSIDLLQDPATRGTFMKIVNGMQRREKRTAGGLSANNMEEYRQHFLTTFGASPSGSTDMIDDMTISDTDDQSNIRIKKHGGLTSKMVQEELRYLARGKAAGIDGFPAEVWQIQDEVLARVLHELFCICEQLYTIPTEWCSSLVTLLYKNKGSVSDVSNYRPISLTCVVRRLYEKLVRRLYEHRINKKLSEQQGGFRKQRSTYDQISRVQEMVTRNKTAVITCLDFANAYDCVDRDILWSTLRHQFHLSKHSIRILRSMFDHNKSYLLVEGQVSAPIANTRGLLQGSSLSPGLFNAYINSMSEELAELGGGLVVEGDRINHLLFADDTLLANKDEDETQEALDTAEAWSQDHGLIFKVAKCKTVLKGLKDVEVYIYQTRLEVKEKHTYVGVVISGKGVDWTASMKPRLESARNRIHWLAAKGMNLSGWRVVMSIAIFKSFIRPLWEYGMGLTILPECVLNAIQAVQNTALRRILSCGKSTSIYMLHSLLGIEFVKDRNNKLNAEYMQQVLYGRKRCHPVGRLMRESVKRLNKLPAGSFIKRFWKYNRWRVRMVREGYIENKLYEKDRVKRLLRLRRTSCAGLARSKIWVTDGDPLLRDSGSSRRIMYQLWQWKLGNCGGSWRKCTHCSELLSKDHFLTCGGGGKLIRKILRKLGNRRIRWKDNSQRLNWILDSMELEENSQREQLYHHIGEMLEQCRVKTMDWMVNDGISYAGDNDPQESINKRLAVMRASLERRRKKKILIVRRRCNSRQV